MSNIPGLSEYKTLGIFAYSEYINQKNKLNQQLSDVSDQIKTLEQQYSTICGQQKTLEKQEKQRCQNRYDYEKQRRLDDDKMAYETVKLVINGCATFEFTHQFEVEPTMQKYKPNGNGICQLFDINDSNRIHQLSLSIDGETIVRDFNLSQLVTLNSQIFPDITISINFNQKWFLYCRYIKDSKMMEFITIKNECNLHNIY